MTQPTSEIVPTAPAEGAPATPPAPTADPAGSQTPTTPPAAAPATPANPWEDPKAAQAEIEKLRRENAASRTNAKATAAEEAKKELAQTIGRALGLVEDEQIDPTKLTESLTAAQSQAKQAQVELAVFRAAQGAEADAAALLDSRTFLAKVADIDPSDSAALTAAITEAIEQNPRLGKAIPTTPGMKPNPAQGRSASPPLGLDEQIAAARSAGDMRSVMRLKAAQTVKNSNP